MDPHAENVAFLHWFSVVDELQVGSSFSAEHFFFAHLQPSPLLHLPLVVSELHVAGRSTATTVPTSRTVVRVQAPLTAPVHGVAPTPDVL